MNPWKIIQETANRDFTLFALRMAITIWALFVIAITWLINNKWLLGGILAYEILP